MDYSIKIDAFEGPLDLLLHLIKKSNIDIYDINIEEITKQYLDYINKMEELNIDVASSYLVMAAELIELKSKLLLPNQNNEENEEEENTKENLIQRLLNYEKYKDIAEAMGVDTTGMSQEEYRKAAVDAVKQLSKDVGIPADLKEIVKEEDLQILSESALADACCPGNPRDTSVEEIKELYKSLL